VFEEENSGLFEVTVSTIVRKEVHLNVFLIPNGYQDTAVWIYGPNCVGILFVAWDEERSLQNKGGYARRIARPHFGRCCPHKGT
jgi:hypothetical protein